MSGAEVSIERMRAEDVASVVAIDRSSTSSSAWDEAMLAGELDRSWAHLWVARPRARNAASALPIAFLATWLVADELHILNIATAPEHRRKGHARALLAVALDFAIEHRVRMLLLEVRRSNAEAIGLYRRLGFAAIGLRVRYYGDEEDAVEMVLRLDELGRVVPSPDEVRLS